MQATNLPVLILAQSGRFLAQSATQAGYSAWVADCFGDQDTLDIAERWQQTPPFSKLTLAIFLKTLLELTQGEPCILIAGSGVELYYPLLNNLPDNIQLVGNSVQTIKQIKTPPLFFKLLDQLAIPYPHSQFKQPKDSKDYLIKSASGLGGEHIQNLGNATATSDCYFQRLVAGESGSILILANGKSAKVISLNQQFIAPSSNAPFRLGSIETPWKISNAHRQELEQAANKITAEIELLGLNSIDFIISENNELLLLEVNPRPSASAELISKEIPLFQYHINASLGDLPTTPVVQSNIKASLHYFYADDNYTVPTDMNWSEECCDLPQSGSTIKKGQPICTIIAQRGKVKNIKQSLILQMKIL